MPHANLDQVRAFHAHEAASKTDRASVSKLPGMILTNGLLATLAFACESGKAPRAGMKSAADSLATYLSGRLPSLGAVNTGEILAMALASRDALTLQRATSEALAYLTYLKRYALPKKTKA
jgi:CRISPR type III-B/RAMP module-associated protein Cmr5